MTAKVKARRPLVAVLLSFLMMGLGQLYNGQFRRAVVFYAIVILGSVVAGTINANFLSYYGILVLYFLILIYGGIWIFSVIDAAISARRIGELELRRYNRWYVYAPLLLVTILVQTVLEGPLAPYSISSGSMTPTMLVGDFVYADRSAYRDREPERGDVAVFKLPADNSTDYIKRVIGLPGDRIQVRGGILHINQLPVKRNLRKVHEIGSVTGRTFQVNEYLETLPGGREYLIWEDGDHGPYDNTPEYVVPPGHYFVLGDNRDRSQDSRTTSNVGFVPLENLVGPAEIVFFSVNGRFAWWRIWRWPEAIRFSRIGVEIY